MSEQSKPVSNRTPAPTSAKLKATLESFSREGGTKPGAEKQSAEQVLQQHRTRRHELRKAMTAALGLIPYEQRITLFATVLVQQTEGIKRSQAALARVNPASAAALAIMTDLLEARNFVSEVIKMSEDKQAPNALAGTIEAAESRVIDMGGADLLEKARNRRANARTQKPSQEESEE